MIKIDNVWSLCDDGDGNSCYCQRDDDHDDGIDGDNYGAKNNVDKMSTCSHRFEGYRDIT